MCIRDSISLDDITGTNPYGHVVVYGEGDLSNALVIDQNYAGEQVVRKHRYNILSILRPLRIVRFRNQDKILYLCFRTTCSPA